MSNTPATVNGTDVSGIDWRGPMVEIIDELVGRRQDWYRNKTGYVTEAQQDNCYQWGDEVAMKHADSLHSHLEGKV